MNSPPRSGTVAAADAVSFLATFVLVFLTIGALFAIDTVLAQMERSESRSEARRFYEQGVRLAAEREQVQAADRFRSAVSAERTNPVYQRALAAALLAAGRIPEAETVATERLQVDPTDAAASLIMARALAGEGKVPQAISFFHRAIYGQWDKDAAGNRIRARFELVDLLAGQDSLRQDLLAELLPLQREAPTDIATQVRIARLLTAAGSPSRAIEILRDILRRVPRSADVSAALGEAEFERGNYRSAMADFTAAARLDPASPKIAAGLASTNQVLALDPTQRGLGAEERYRRSLALLDLTIRAADSCAGAEPVRALADSARMAGGQHLANPRYSMVEENLDLAERLWQARRKECPAPVPESERPLALVLDRAAQ